ncbi:MAG: hypothetical protein WC666_03675 [Candidatus Paceibacterota bacterium]|jgi:hypothetical protein
MKVVQTLTGIELVKYGYVHVTGLPTNRGHDEDGESKNVIKSHPQSLGRYDHNNGVAVVNTMDGEVWIRFSSGNEEVLDNSEYANLLGQLCPNGNGAFVPCSNGEAIPSYMVLTRVANPYWTGYNNECQFTQVVVSRK